MMALDIQDKSLEKGSTNFSFLKPYGPIFIDLASSAERAFISDPNTTLIKLRQLGEAMAQDIAARCGIEFDDKTTQVDLLYKIHRELNLEPVVRQLFHSLRIEGNKATHQFITHHKEALEGLKLALSLAIWFHHAFDNLTAPFKAGPFVPPQDPSKQLQDLQTQIEQLRSELNDNHLQLTDNQQLTELIAREKEEYAVLAEQMDAEARVLSKQAAEHEKALMQQKLLFESRIKALQAELAQQAQTDSKAASKYRSTLSKQASKSGNHIELSEELTRVLIDQQLNKAMQRIYSEHEWNPLQRKWLDRFAKQLVHEAVIDKAFVNQRFADQGGVKQFNRVLDDQLDTILGELNEYLWQVSH